MSATEHTARTIVAHRRASIRRCSLDGARCDSRASAAYNAKDRGPRPQEHTRTGHACGQYGDGVLFEVN